MAESVAELFESGQAQQVQLAYTRFLSMGSQEVTVDQFMPLEASEIGADAAEEAEAVVTNLNRNHLKYWGVFFPVTQKPAYMQRCSRPQLPNTQHVNAP